MEYPVGISYFAYAAAKVTQLLAGSPDLEARQRVGASSLFGRPDVQREIRIFVIVHALAFAALALLSAWLLAGVNRRRPWDAALFAASPALALTFLVNWDMLAVVMVAAALWSWARGRPILTGVLIGLGTATKLYPLFLLGGLLVICLRERRWRELIGVDAGGRSRPGWSSTRRRSSPVRDQWKVFWTFNSERTADLGSVWLVISQATDHAFTAHTINLWSYAHLRRLVRRRRAARLDWRRPLHGSPSWRFLVVAGFLLVNKVYSPQYVLWLLPLAVLARPRWRDQIIWQAGEVVYFASVWWYLDGELAAGRRRGRRLLLARRSRSGSRASCTSARWSRATSGGRGTTRSARRRSACDRRRRLRRSRRGRTSSRCSAPARRRCPRQPAPWRRPAGSSIEACMCGGSANSRCSPSTQNGERTLPCGVQAAAGHGRGPVAQAEPLIGDSRPMPCAVPPLTTSRWPSFGAGRPR